MLSSRIVFSFLRTFCFFSGVNIYHTFFFCLVVYVCMAMTFQRLQEESIPFFPNTKAQRIISSLHFCPGYFLTPAPQPPTPSGLLVSRPVIEWLPRGFLSFFSYLKSHISWISRFHFSFYSHFIEAHPLRFSIRMMNGTCF